MRNEKIYTKNATYQKFEVLKSNRNKRYKYKEFFVEGVKNINAALKNNWDISSFLYTDEKELSIWAQQILNTTCTEVNYQLPLNLMKELSDKEDTSELLAIVKMREDNAGEFQLSKNPLLALFDRPSNRGNLGTIIRSCDALGVEGLILTGHGVDLYDPEVITSSMGSFFRIPVIRMTDNHSVILYITELKAKFPGFTTIGTTAHKEFPIYKLNLTGPLMFFVGNETDGLSRVFKECSDKLATIPMAEGAAATSFNVGCAATVMFYEAIRQRNLNI
jgi:TrmH family RNA methyltransferase